MKEVHDIVRTWESQLQFNFGIWYKQNTITKKNLLVFTLALALAVNVEEDIFCEITLEKRELYEREETAK